MKALSIRQPWAWFILHGGKDIENRSWRTPFRGTVLVHASSWWRHEEAQGDMFDAAAIMRETGFIPADVIPDPDRILRPSYIKSLTGQVLGTVEIVDCVTESASPWFFGRYGFVLRNPVVFARPFPFKARLGFFDVPDDLVAGAGVAEDAKP